MATESYMQGRSRYSRPQAMLWANNPGTLTEAGLYIPTGLEYGVDQTDQPESLAPNSFLILSDDNRSEIQMTSDRIENRERMINGRMRSHHIADKRTVSTSWSMLPSRSYAEYPNFDGGTGISPMKNDNSMEYTTDGGAGGNFILDWYNTHPGSFWVYLAYDRHTLFSGDDEYSKLGQYNEIFEVYFNDFSYNIVKRGASNFDFWNINLSLEEV
jgi:hypothetical protein